LKSDQTKVKEYAALVEKATTQTTAARKLLYNPGDTAKAELKRAAEKMEDLIQFMDAGKTFKQGWNQAINKKFNRQLGTQQISSDATKTTILEIVARIKLGKGTGKDHAALIALIGDVGTAVGDLGSGKSVDIDQKKVIDVETDKDKKKKLQDKKDEFDAFTMAYKRMYSCCIPEETLRKDETLKALANGIYQERSGDAQTGGCKKQQRDDIKVNGEKKMDPRGGVFECNIEHQIDIALGIKKENVEKDAIPLVKWPWQTVSKAVMDSCPAEPWAGHYSGSVVEILMIFDLFNYISKADSHDAHPLASYDYTQADFPVKPVYDSKRMNSASRRARAALASAYLISNGMHSANEVAFSVKLYLGLIQKNSKDRKAKCDTAATVDISSLMTEATAK